MSPFRVQATTTRPKIIVTADGAGVVSHAGSRLLADVADRTTLTGELCHALGVLRPPRARHDPGRVLVDLAVAVADGATTISEIDVLRDQRELFGAVASDSTCWRLLDRLDDTALAAVAAARVRAREVVWDQHAELHGRAFPPATVAGRDLDLLVIDLDASIVICHSEKEQAAPTFKRTFGYHPLMAFCDNTSEFLSGMLRRGNAGANTAADHITVLNQALAQIPDPHRHGRPILVRADTAGCTKAFLGHIRDQHAKLVSCEFSVGWAITDRERTAIGMVPRKVWADAVDADGSHRDGAGLAELTGLLPAAALEGYPSGDAGDRPPRAPAPRRAAGPDGDPRRLALHLLRHRHPGRTTRLPRRPSPGPRPGRGPDPHREGHRPEPLPVPHVRDQLSLADRRDARRRPALRDPAPRPRRAPRQGRTEDAALPAAARRRPDHPRPATHLRSDPAVLALGRAARGRVRPAPRPARPRRLNHPHGRHERHGAPGRTAGRTILRVPTRKPKTIMNPRSATGPHESPGLGSGIGWS
jgi:hypothetical protein